MDEPRDIAERIFTRFKSERGRELSIVAWYLIAELFYGPSVRPYNRQLLDVAELGDMISQEKV